LAVRSVLGGGDEREVGSAPLADVPCLHELPRLIRLKYLTNRWTTLSVFVTVKYASRNNSRPSCRGGRLPRRRSEVINHHHVRNPTINLHPSHLYG
jgi:hypothetical protein